MLTGALRIVGNATLSVLAETGGLWRLGTTALGRYLAAPMRGQPLRVRAAILQTVRAGYSSLPLVALISFLVGMIMALQGVGLAILIEMKNNKATRDTLVARNELPVYAAIEVSHRSARLLRVIRKPNSRSPCPPLALERLKDPAAALERLDDLYLRAASDPV